MSPAMCKTLTEYANAIEINAKQSRRGQVDDWEARYCGSLRGIATRLRNEKLDSHGHHPCDYGVVPDWIASEMLALPGEDGRRAAFRKAIELIHVDEYSSHHERQQAVRKEEARLREEDRREDREAKGSS